VTWRIRGILQEAHLCLRDYHAGEALPRGFSLVDKTVSGRPLKDIIALAVRRQAYDGQHR